MIIEVVAITYKNEYIYVWRHKNKDRNHNLHKARMYRINNTFYNCYIYDNDKIR